MKVTLSWLKDHLETTADVAALSARLTALGLEVEAVSDRGAALAAFTVAHVISAEKHPNADKLRVCMVDTGRETIQVVCGAPNARAGMKGVFAPAGATIPASGTVLKKGVIRGVESNGMLCSEREMGLSDEHAGIIELPEDAPVGQPFAAVAGLDDPLLTLSLTPDRADCAAIRGLARDLAAAGLGALKPLVCTPVPGVFPSPVGVTLAPAVTADGACPLFVGRYIRGVRNGPSPAWLQDKLKAVGLRPISILVDVTNYLTLDIARPLHVFDADKLTGDICVRFARAGETLTALNGKTYTLDPTMTAIADDAGVLGLAGIIGGESTGCQDETVNVFIEAALFDSVRTGATGRRLGVDSDARYRFERGVDPDAVFNGMERATRLILDLCGGTPSALVVAGSVPNWQRQQRLRPDRVQTLGGTDVPVSEQIRILQDLGFVLVSEAEEAGTDPSLTFTIPSWRPDVQGEADLVEEILRVHGYDAIPVTPLPRLSVLTRPAVTPSQRRTGFLRRVLAGRGLNEAVTWSFLATATAAPFGGVPEALRLRNPISSDLDGMRPSLLPNLLHAAGRNADRGYPDARLFEVGPEFRSADPAGQVLVAAGVRCGQTPRHWMEPTRPVDVYDAKADALAVLEAAGAPVANLQITSDAPPWYHPGRSGVVRLGPTVMARFGELHPAVLEALDVKGAAVGFEVYPDSIPHPKKKAGTAKPLLTLSPFQPVIRDFAFRVLAGVEAEAVARAVRGADKALIREVSVFDAYQGKGVEPGYKSLAVAVTVQPVDKPLIEADLEAVAGKIVAAVAKATGGSLRR